MATAGDLSALLKISLSVLASLLYSYFISSKLPKGLPRLLSLLPILYLFTLLPLLVSSILFAGIVASFITWLASFKLLLFSFDLGPLVSEPPFSFPLFASLVCFPVRMKQNQPNPVPENPPKPIDSPKLPLNLPTKVLLFAILTVADEALPRYLKLCYHCAALYFFIDVVVGFFNTIVRWSFGIELEEPSNEPYLATSLQDFWGRRWNILVSNILKLTVFLPVRSAMISRTGRRRSAAVAVFAVFVVSGLMHELLFYYVNRVAPSWEVTAFFVLQGICVLVEFQLKTAVGDKFRLHWAVSLPFTLGFTVTTASWLFFPPVLRNGTVVGLIRECRAGLELAIVPVMSVFRRPS
ncbi:probable long-chain-alcohol O-fatty-acyltransferase 5 [Benincasa hispida]|uniref:probable long-chain-alcohol O-fatty-acyltransferase 5 n=1 Tax=Benincasa hispida TaxID=102211 RepID=UPI0018FFFE0A|nr:probable long-chain-alcohol O-fatty-acyltransferase 5 [Benincasa hispida]